MICTIFIVIGLPLLLTLEQFLNCIFNFTKIKPLLDQFQGCYQDKYRCFAGYYMICRLLIITIVMTNSINEFVANYLLVIACGLIDFIHVTLKPYNKEILNKLDGIILHLTIFVAALPLLNDFDSPSVVTTSFVLAILPLLSFVAMTLFLQKYNLKKIIRYFATKDKTPNNSSVVNNNEIPIENVQFHFIVDDAARQKVTATICDM